MRFSTRIFLLTIIALVAGCNTPLEEGPVLQDPTFEHIADPSYTPADIDEWPAYAFVFQDDTCTCVQQFARLSEVQNIDASEGDLISVIAMENTDNIGFSVLDEGIDVNKYKLLSADMAPMIPRTWGSVFTAGPSEDGFKRVLYPITSDVSITTINAPDSFKGATLRMEDFCNEWGIGSDTYAIGGKSKKADLICTGGAISASFLPPLGISDRWTPDLSIDIADVTVKTDLSLDIKSLTRTSVSICIDFTEYSKTEMFDVSISYGNILTPDKTNTISQTYSTFKSSNRHYRVKSLYSGSWREEEVHDALCSNADKHGNIWNDWNNDRKMRDTMSYCIIDTEFPATIRVRKINSLSTKAEVRPSTYGIEVKECADNYIEFTLPSEAMGKVSVEFNGDRQHNLFIIARNPDTDKPSADAPGVRYFGKGEHTAGTIYLTSGQTLYIDHGAKVFANVKTRGSDITIAGHGILSGEKMKHWGDNMYSYGDFLISTNTEHINSSNLCIKDITMIDSPGWNMIIPKTDGVTVDGVNMISWELNGDGIDVVSSRNVEISNCFIRTYDDAITLKCRFIVNPISDTYNVNIHDCLIWADYARGIVIGPEAGNINKSAGRIHHVTVKDCIFMQHKRGLDDDLRAAFAIGQGSDGQTDLWRGSNPPNTISDITASGLTFDNIDKSGRHVSIWQYSGAPVTMQNISLSDFKIIDNNANRYPALWIKTNGSYIKDLKINNFTINDTKLTGSSSQLSIDKPANVGITVN